MNTQCMTSLSCSSVSTVSQKPVFSCLEGSPTVETQSMPEQVLMDMLGNSYHCDSVALINLGPHGSRSDGGGAVGIMDTSMMQSMNTTVTEPPEVIQHVGIALRTNVIIALTTTLFYGFFCILICYSSYLLLQKGLKSRANLILLAVTLIMFASSTCWWGLELAVIIKQIQDILILNPDHTLESKFSTANHFTSLMDAGQQSLGVIIYLLSDVIVVWRAWVLYPNNRKPIIATVSLLICATKLMVNIMATSLIGYKAWKHHQEIKNNLGPRKKTQVEKILALLVESGILYCFIWIVNIMMSFKSSTSNIDTLSGICIQIAGIYPTIIVILVSHQNTVWEMSDISITADHNGQSLSMPQFATAAESRHSITTEGQVQSRVSAIQMHSYHSVGGIAEVARVEEGLKDEGALV
ncbi:hypothetical protein EW146_g2850 [Bondarzewia mesenterica]|uniref:Uncharacterized protein n=1 Tax=Bondarzewia mesenterica TaxID=1095465 RepID=A0A4S4M0X4_9AGAM|nr:hypothetical protein EW146_g2850 [Bondarzewia mesenterica]